VHSTLGGARNSKLKNTLNFGTGLKDNSTNRHRVIVKKTKKIGKTGAGQSNIFVTLNSPDDKNP